MNIDTKKPTEVSSFQSNESLGPRSTSRMRSWLLMFFVSWNPILKELYVPALVWFLCVSVCN